MIKTGVESIDLALDMMANELDKESSTFDDFEGRKIVGIFNDGRIELTIIDDKETGQDKLDIKVIGGKPFVFDHDLNIVEDDKNA